jgi:hypothetical protein
MLVEDLDHLFEWVRFILVGHAWISFRLLANKRSRRPTVAHPFKQALSAVSLFRYAQKQNGQQQIPMQFTESMLR